MSVYQGPLFEGSSLEVLFPSVEFFTQKIINGDFSSVIRFQIEYWNLIRSAMRMMGIPGKAIPKDLQVDKEFLDLLAKNMIRSFKSDARVHQRRPWKFSEEVFRDHLTCITSPKPKGFYLSVSGRAFDPGEGTADRGEHWKSNLIKTLLPKGETPLLSTVWRKWAVTGEIDKFIQVIKDRQVVIVGPPYYSHLSSKLGLQKHEFIQISLTSACLEVHQTQKQILETYHRLAKDNEEVIFLVSGGSAGAWLAWKLHQKMSRAHFFELGRALDVYFYYDPIRQKYDRWVFGCWMDNHPPRWLKEKG